MALFWSHEIAGVDWQELEAQYQAAPLGRILRMLTAMAFFQDRAVAIQGGHVSEA